MTPTPDVRPVGDLPDKIGKTAARELSLNGITSLRQVATHSKRELLAIHGVGPKAIAILANPAQFYVNVHTNDRPAGALRGQLSAGPAKPTAK